MTRAPQKRRLETRARLLQVTADLVTEQGYSGLRVEDVVAGAGVAKGTLFAHFSDKDGLLAVLVGAKVMRLLDQMETAPAPGSLQEMIDNLTPLLDFLASDRVIFDLLLRYSGSTGSQTDAVISEGFYRQIAIWTGWIGHLQGVGALRQDHPPVLLAEGVQAFVTQVVALHYCLGTAASGTPHQALVPYLQAWLQPVA